MQKARGDQINQERVFADVETFGSLQLGHERAFDLATCDIPCVQDAATRVTAFACQVKAVGAVAIFRL